MTKNHHNKLFHGIIPALITPMNNNGEINKNAFRKLIQTCLSAGVDGFVPVGTTGESPTLTHDEHDEVIALCISEVSQQVPVIAGTGSNSTAEAVRLTQHAEKAGANAALVVSPYYNKPTQAGLYAHFSAIANNTSLPIIIYNIPGRCSVDVEHSTLIKLAQNHKNIVGVKDATNNLQRPTLVKQDLDSSFCQLSGEDATFSGFLAQGGDGIISVAANVAPKEYVSLYQAWLDADLQSFATHRDKLFDLAQALFCESSPAPIKYALSRIGLCSDYVRLPLVVASDEARLRVDKALRLLDLLD